MRSKLLISVIVVGVVGIFLWSYQSTINNKQTTVATFEECVAGGNAVAESYPRQCTPANGQVFTESLGPRAEAFRACATADIPLVSLDTLLDVENGLAEVRWNDPETGEAKFLLLPYDPSNIYKGCSDSARRVLQHISNVDVLPQKYQ